MNILKHLIATGMLVCMACASLNAQTTLYWTGETDSDWNDVNNWSATPGGTAAPAVPTSADIVVFTTGAKNDCGLDVNASVAEVLIDENFTGTLDLDGHTLTVAGGFTQHAGTFQGGTAAIAIGGLLHLIGGGFHSTTGVLSLEEGIIEEGEYFQPHGGKVRITGTGATIDLTGFFYDLEIETGAGAELANSLSVAHVLTLDGPLLAGTHGIVLGNASPSAVGGTSGAYFETDWLGGFGLFVWAIGGGTGTYTFPFLATPTGPVVPLEIDVTAAGTGTDGRILATNLELDGGKPQDILGEVGGYYDATGGNNAGYNINRIWMVVLGDYDESPTFDLGFSYTTAGLAGTTLTEANLKAQYHNEKHWGELLGTVSTSANTFAVTGQTGSTDGYAHFWTLVDNTSPNKSTYGGNTGLTCADAVELDSIETETVYEMVDTVMWFRFTNSSSLDWYLKLHPLDVIRIDSVQIFETTGCPADFKHTIPRPLSYTRQINLGLLPSTTYYAKLFKSASQKQIVAFAEFGQADNECGTYKDDSTSIMRTSPASCDFTYYNDFVYKTVYVNFHFMQNDDGTGNFTETGDGGKNPKRPINGYQVADDYVVALNAWLQNHPNEVYRLTGTNNDSCAGIGQVLDTIISGVPALPPMFRFQIYKNPAIPGDQGVYFQQSTYYRSLPRDSQNIDILKELFSVNGEKVIDIFFVEGDHGGKANIPPGDALISYGTHTNYASPEFIHLSKVNNLYHELGHCLGLGHAFAECQGDDACGDTYPTGFLCGCTQVGSNNIMDYDSNNVFITLCQLEILHKRMATHPAVVVEDTSLCLFNTAHYVIDSNTTVVWDSLMVMSGNVIVKPGAILTIECMVQMPSNSRIIVERAGKLIIDGGSVMPICPNTKWEGIEVWGFDTLGHPLLASVTAGTYPSSYAHHGVVIIKNKGIVQGAGTGIYVGKRTGPASHNYDRQYSGGIVLVLDSAVLLGNITGINFLPFSKPVISRVVNSEIRMSPYPLAPNAHIGINISRVNGFTIKRSNIWGTFLLANPSAGQVQYGINAFESQFVCDSVVFYGMSIGLVNMASRVKLPVTKVTHCNFESAVGIVTYGDEYNVIEHNSFLPQSSTYHVNGLIAYGSNAFRLRNNKFTESTSSGVLVELLYLSNTGLFANEIKLNEVEYIGFNDNSRGIVAAQNNAGLKIRCNDFTFHPLNPGPHLYDGNLDVYGPIAELQGLCGNNGSPANNYFADDCGFSSTTGIHIFTNPGVPPFLYHFIDNNSRFEPDDNCIINQNSFQKIGCLELTGDYCTETYGRVSIPDGWVTARPIRDTLRNGISVIAVKLDAGNTPGLVGYVNGGSESNVLDSLDGMELISDEALLALIHRSPAVDAERLAHILVNTAPHSNVLLMSLEEREEPIPSDSLEKIYQYRDSISLRKPIVDSLGYFRNELELVYNGLIFIADEDGYQNYSLDSVIALLEEEADVNLKLKLADLYIANGQYVEAEAVWDSIPVYYDEIAQHIYLRRMQLGLLEDGLDLEDLNGDELGNLADLATSNTKAAWQAKAMLIALGLDTIPIEIEDRIYTSPKTSNEQLVKQNDNKPIGGTWLKLYPNPVNSTLTLEYSLFDEQVGCTFGLFDLFGKQIRTYTLKNTNGTLTMDVSGLSNGIYLCNLNTKGAILWQEKLVIIR